MEITATYIRHSEVTEGTSASGNAWRKVNAIFETLGDYPKTIAFSALNSTVERVLQLQSGRTYKVSFDLTSREYNGKWYTDAKAWAINEPEPATGGQRLPDPKPQPKAVQTDMFNQPAPCHVVAFAADGDDLPF